MDKKDIVLNKNKRNILFPVIIAAVILLTIIVLLGKKESDGKTDSGSKTSQSSSTNRNSRYKAIKDKDGVVTFPISSFDENVQYFQYKFDTKTVKFFILKSNDGTIRAAFDACDVCYRSRRGYNQVGDYMRCNNCKQVFPEDQINVVLGGCNPSPLTREIIGENLVIKVEDIALGKRFF